RGAAAFADLVLVDGNSGGFLCEPDAKGRALALPGARRKARAEGCIAKWAARLFGFGRGGFCPDGCVSECGGTRQGLSPVVKAGSCASFRICFAFVGDSGRYFVLRCCKERTHTVVAGDLHVGVSAPFRTSTP